MPTKRDMRRIVVAIAALAIAGVGLSSGRARAQQAGESFVEQGRFVIGAERVTGFALTQREAEFQAGSVSTDFEADTTSLSLLASQAESPFTTPRVGFDYMVVDRVSVGGFVGYSNWDTDQELGDSEQEPESSLLLLGLRGGYGHAFSDLLALWPRAGLSYATTSADDLGENELSANVLALSAEVLVVVTPAEHVIVFGGPTIDYTLTGDGEYDPAVGADVEIEDLRVNTFGVQAGVGIWF